MGNGELDPAIFRANSQTQRPFIAFNHQSIVAGSLQLECFSA
jgi:hypothetical protein